MTKLNTVLLCTSMLLAPGAIFAAEGRRCHIGKLLDVEVSTRTIETTQVERTKEKRKKNGDREYTTYTPSSTRESTTYRVKVALEDMVYTAESNGDWWGYNPTNLVVNDPIEACVESRRLVIMRPDGKQYKPTIVRAVRNSKPAATDSGEAERP